VLAAPAAALDGSFVVLPNGSAYRGTIPLEDVETYAFTEPGILGERVPLRVSEVRLFQDDREVPVNWSRPTEIMFPKGNYTLEYTASVKENHLVLTFLEPSEVEIQVPPSFRVENPFLGMVSPGGAVSRGVDNGTVIHWNATRNAEVRFYDEGRETLLGFFAQFWFVIAVVLLMPYLLTWRRKKKK